MVGGFWTDLGKMMFGGAVLNSNMFAVETGNLAMDKIPGTSVTTAQLNAPTNILYPNPQQPPAAKSVAAGASTLPAPYTEEEYNSALDAVLKNQVENWQAQDRDFFRNAFAADIGEDAPLLPGLPNLPAGSALWLVLGAAGVGIVLLLLVTRK